jgi:hypothetical protein
MVSTVGFIVAGVGAAVGVVGLFVHPSSSPAPQQTGSISPWIGPGMAGASGTF